jgi:hypothetical protein
MARLIMSMFLFTYAWSNLAIAAEAFAYSGESEQHMTYELHDTVHDLAHNSDLGNDQSDDEQLEHNTHHHCAHNLVGMACAMPATHRSDATTLLAENSADPHYFELQQRLLRPPRN